MTATMNRDPESNVSEIDVLVAELRHAHDGEPWHGPSRAAVLADVGAAEAAWRPPGGGHSIWELVLHMAGWTDEVVRRLRGGTPGLPEAGDFPPVPAAITEESWDAARRALDAAHARLVDAVRAFPPERLAEPVGDTRDAPLGTGVTYGMMLRGVLQHDAYHSGQAAVLKRIARAAGR